MIEMGTRDGSRYSPVLFPRPTIVLRRSEDIGPHPARRDRGVAAHAGKALGVDKGRIEASDMKRFESSNLLDCGASQLWEIPVPYLYERTP